MHRIDGFVPNAGWFALVCAGLGLLLMARRIQFIIRDKKEGLSLKADILAPILLIGNTVWLGIVGWDLTGVQARRNAEIGVNTPNDLPHMSHRMYIAMIVLLAGLLVTSLLAANDSPDSGTIPGLGTLCFGSAFVVFACIATENGFRGGSTTWLIVKLLCLLIATLIIGFRLLREIARLGPDPDRVKAQ